MRQGSYEHWGGMLEGKKCFSVFREYSGTEYSVVKGCPPKHEPPPFVRLVRGPSGPCIPVLPRWQSVGPQGPGDRRGTRVRNGIESSRLNQLKLKKV